MTSRQSRGTGGQGTVDLGEAGCVDLLRIQAATRAIVLVTNYYIPLIELLVYTYLGY
jgi:hypothetical protein